MSSQIALLMDPVHAVDGFTDCAADVFTDRDADIFKEDFGCLSQVGAITRTLTFWTWCGMGVGGEGCGVWSDIHLQLTIYTYNHSTTSMMQLLCRLSTWSYTKLTFDGQGLRGTAICRFHGLDKLIPNLVSNTPQLGSFFFEFRKCLSLKL